MNPHHFGLRTLRDHAGRLLVGLAVAAVSAGLMPATLAREGGGQDAAAPRRGARGFHVEEATIADVHRAIQEGATTCRAIVQSYIERARAYNGACVQLVTRDGASIPAVTGVVRGGSAVMFPTATTA